MRKKETENFDAKNAKNPRNAKVFRLFLSIRKRSVPLVKNPPGGFLSKVFLERKPPGG